MAVDSEASLVRALWFYRLALATVVLVGLGSAWAVSRRQAASAHRFGAPDATWTIDLLERKAYVDAHYGEYDDLAEDYGVVGDVAVQMHFIGPGQTTPWHVHTASDEATIVVSDDVAYAWQWGEAGAIAERRADVGANMLVSSPRSTLHTLHRPETGRFLPALTMTRPPRKGERYVQPGDARALQGTEPAVVMPDAIGTAGVATDEALGFLGGSVRAVRVADAWTVPSTEGRPVMFYVASGEGTLDALALRPATLAHVAQDGPAVVHATGGDLVLYVIDPLGVLAP